MLGPDRVGLLGQGGGPAVVGQSAPSSFQLVCLRHLPAYALNPPAERLVTLVDIVASASERKILDARGPTARKRDHMVELQTAGLGASAA